MAIFRWEPRNGGVECRCGRQKSRFWANIWFHCVLLTLLPPGIVNTTLSDHRAESCDTSLVVSCGVCWRRERTAKCLWQEVSTLHLRQQNSFFAAQCDAYARPMPSCGVCVSVAFMSCVKTNKDIFEIFPPSGGHTILVFYTKRDGDIPTGTPLTGRRMQVGYTRQKSRFWAYACCWRCNRRGVVNMVVGGRRPDSAGYPNLNLGVCRLSI